MILFFNDVEEDFMYIKERISDGTLTIERIDNALRRILALRDGIDHYAVVDPSEIWKNVRL